MSTPMYDLPDHLQMGVDKFGRGPVMEDDPEFSHYGCWCGNPDCIEWIEEP